MDYWTENKGKKELYFLLKYENYLLNHYSILNCEEHCLQTKINSILIMFKTQSKSVELLK